MKQILTRIKIAYYLVFRPDLHYVLVLLSTEELTNMIIGKDFELSSIYYDRMQKKQFYDIVKALNNSIDEKDYNEAEKEFINKAKELGLTE